MKLLDLYINFRYYKLFLIRNFWSIVYYYHLVPLFSRQISVFDVEFVEKNINIAEFLADNMDYTYKFIKMVNMTGTLDSVDMLTQLIDYGDIFKITYEDKGYLKNITINLLNNKYSYNHQTEEDLIPSILCFP